MVPTDVISHPGNKKLWVLFICFLIHKSIQIVQKHVMFPPCLPPKALLFKMEYFPFNMDFQNDLVLRTYMRQTPQNPMIYNFSVKIYVVPLLEDHFRSVSLFIIVEFRLSSSKLPLSCQKEILIFAPDQDGMKWYASFCYASYIIMFLSPKFLSSSEIRF